MEYTFVAFLFLYFYFFFYIEVNPALSWINSQWALGTDSCFSSSTWEYCPQKSTYYQSASLTYTSRAQFWALVHTRGNVTLKRVLLKREGKKERKKRSRKGMTFGKLLLTTLPWNKKDFETPIFIWRVGREEYLQRRHLTGKSVLACRAVAEPDKSCAGS